MTSSPRTRAVARPHRRGYYEAGARFALDETRAAGRNPWQKLAIEATIDDALVLQADLAARILASEHTMGADPRGARTAAGALALGRAGALVRELCNASTPDLAMLVVAGRQLRQWLG